MVGGCGDLAASLSLVFVDRPLQPYGTNSPTFIERLEIMRPSKPAIVKTLHTFIHRRIALACIALLGMLAATPAAAADRLVHTDGTVIEGRIVSQTQAEISIETQYGTFRYPMHEITEIIKDKPEPTPTPPPATPTPVNYQTALPRGPINPNAPPSIQNLVAMAARGIPPPGDGTTTPSAVTRPAAPVTTATAPGTNPAAPPVPGTPVPTPAIP